MSSDPEHGHGAVLQHRLDGQHVVRGESVLQAVRAAGVLRDVAADRAHHLGGRVGRVVEVVHAGRRADRQVGDPGLHDGRPPIGIYLKNPVEPRQRDHDARFGRQRASGQPGPGAARDVRDAVPKAGAHDRRHLRALGGEQHQSGQNPVRSEGVGLVRAPFGGAGERPQGGAAGGGDVRQHRLERPFPVHAPHPHPLLRPALDPPVDHRRAPPGKPDRGRARVDTGGRVMYEF
jgi:hypothetical protein